MIDAVLPTKIELKAVKNKKIQRIRAHWDMTEQAGLSRYYKLKLKTKSS